MRESLHLWWTPPAEPPAAGVFAGLRVHLHGARQFTQPFGQLLLHAGERGVARLHPRTWLVCKCS